MVRADIGSRANLQLRGVHKNHWPKLNSSMTSEGFSLKQQCRFRWASMHVFPEQSRMIYGFGNMCRPHGHVIFLGLLHGATKAQGKFYDSRDIFCVRHGMNNYPTNHGSREGNIFVAVIRLLKEQGREWPTARP